MTNDREKFYKQYARIVQYCVDNSTNYIKSSWFFKEFPGETNDCLKSLCSGAVLEFDRQSRVYYVKSLYSHVRWIGKLCAQYAYLSDGKIDTKTELQIAAKETKLDDSLLEFLCLTTDLSITQRANILEISNKELQYLEDYFFLRMGFIVIRKRLKLPFSDAMIEENPNYFTSKVEKFDSTGVSS